MDMHVSVARQRQREMLERAQLRRNARLVQALNRAGRSEARAARRGRKARLQASRLRRLLEAGS